MCHLKKIARGLHPKGVEFEWSKKETKAWSTVSNAWSTEAGHALGDVRANNSATSRGPFDTLPTKQKRYRFRPYRCKCHARLLTRAYPTSVFRALQFQIVWKCLFWFIEHRYTCGCFEQYIVWISEGCYLFGSICNDLGSLCQYILWVVFFFLKKYLNVISK